MHLSKAENFGLFYDPPAIYQICKFVKLEADSTIRTSASVRGCHHWYLFVYHCSMTNHNFQRRQHLPLRALKISKHLPRSDVCELYTAKFIFNGASVVIILCTTLIVHSIALHALYLSNGSLLNCIKHCYVSNYNKNKKLTRT